MSNTFPSLSFSLAKSSNLSGRKFKCIDKDKCLSENEELEKLWVKYKEERGFHSVLVAMLEAVTDIFIGIFLNFSK